MQIVWRLSAFAHEQPDSRTWAALAAATQRFATDAPGMHLGVVGSAPERDELAARLAEVPGAVFTLAPDTTYDADDLATADYVAVFPRGQRLHVANPEALEPAGSCPGCGLEDTFDVTQTSPFVVADDTSPGDTSALPGGAMAVSSRFVGVLGDLGATGWVTEQIIDQATGRASSGWSQLVAERAVLLPCEHTVVDGDGFCPHCRRALGNVAGYVWVQPPDLAGLDVASRHPSRRAMFCLSRRVLAALAAAGMDDFTLTDPLMICHRHG